MKAKTVKEALIAVKWMLENIGWCQQRFYQDSKGRSLGLDNVHNFNSFLSAMKVCSMCLEGAIELVEVDDECVRGGMYDALDAALAPRYGEDEVSLIKFNDDVSTKKKDVIRLLNTAIKQAK